MYVHTLVLQKLYLLSQGADSLHPWCPRASRHNAPDWQKHIQNQVVSKTSDAMKNPRVINNITGDINEETAAIPAYML